jgi:hypothetical protein
LGEAPSGDLRLVAGLDLVASENPDPTSVSANVSGREAVNAAEKLLLLAGKKLP